MVVFSTITVKDCKTNPSVSSCLLTTNNFKTIEWVFIKCTFNPFQFWLKLDNNWHLTLTSTRVSMSICRVTEERSCQEWNIIVRKVVQKEKTPNLDGGLSVSQTTQLGRQTPSMHQMTTLTEHGKWPLE